MFCHSTIIRVATKQIAEVTFDITNVQIISS